ncbi:MAG: aminotransferase class V-fold PLP-dependent enzyme [Planctomycetota bacterium]
MGERYFLDANAGGSVDPRVREHMRALPDEADANPASPHALGRAARALLEDARERVAALCGVGAGEVVFTSGGTEADNLAVATGLAWCRARGGEAWLSPIEHPSVAAPLAAAVTAGAAHRPLAADRRGLVVAPEAADRPFFLSLVEAQPETGVVQDHGPFARLAADGHGLLHVDSSQAFGRVPTPTTVVEAGLRTLSPHKCGGPKGVGVLVVRDGIEVAPVLRGGPQELGRRPGTQCARLAQGAALALELAALEVGERRARMQAALDAFLAPLVAGGACRVMFEDAPFLLPNTRTIDVTPHEARHLLPALDLAGLCLSFGSACSSGAQLASRSLLACGVDERTARRCLRVSVTHDSGEEKMKRAAVLFLQALARV